jgi:hypothetical protein
MKLILKVFLLGVIGHTESKSFIPQYKHISYFYNTTDCNNSVPTIVEFINYNNCEINNLNKCVQPIQSKNGSVFKTCSIEPVIYNTNVKASVILTILLMFLAFLMYKICCQPELDNVCLKMKYKCEYLCCNEDDETQYINDYNSL